MTLDLIRKTLHESGLLDVVRSVCAGKTECYLVGGAIRDCLTGRPLNDFDFCFPDNPTEYARQIAEQLQATFFILDAERGHSRFVLKSGGRKLTCDFAPFRAPSLESDLRKRDFTINAMAMACSHDALDLIDPLQGQVDLNHKTLKACSEYSFQDDPLRCLKGIRHAVSMDLEFDPDTMRRLIDSASQIDQVASERIRSELARAVASGSPVRVFEMLGQTGLHRELFGPATPEAYAAGLLKVKQLVDVIKGLRSGTCGRVVDEYLDASCEEDVSVEVALLLSAFCYGYRPVALSSVLNALRFSKRTINLIKQLNGLDESIVETYGLAADKVRSRARWLDRLGGEALATAIFIPLVSSGNLQEQLLQVELLFDSYSSSIVNGRLAELVDGSWLAEELNELEGPEIGRLYTLLHQAEIAGEATTPDEAQQWLLARYKD